MLSLSRAQAAGALAYPAAVGLGTLAVVGGWLNVLNLAYPPVLAALLVAGWIAAFKYARATERAQWNAMYSGTTLLLGGVILLIGFLLGIALLPGGAFNPSDDLVTYVSRLARMSQTGTFGHDPFSPLGLESLGAHAFLQSFTILAFDPGFLNAFDAVFCAVLSLCLVAEIGLFLNLQRVLILSAVVTAILIHPSQVNLSAVYSITCFALAMVLAATELLSTPELPVRRLWQRVIPLALLCAGMAALKSTTYVFLVTSGFPFVLLAGFARDARFAARAALLVIAAASIFLSPWILLSADKYRHMLPGGAEPFVAVVGNPGDLLGSADLFWGGTPRAYTFVALFVFLMAGIAALARVRSTDARSRTACVSLVALCGGAVASYALNIIPFDVTHSVRYSAPLLIAATAAAVLLGGHLISDAVASKARTEAPTPYGWLFACAVPIAIAGMFATAIKDRIWNAVSNRSALALPLSGMKVLVRYTDWALGAEARRSVIRAQAQTAPGASVLAVIATPHQLLFTRNRIFVAFEFGLPWPWLDFPVEPDPKTFRDFLHHFGIRYVIWDKDIPGMSREEDIRRNLADDNPIFRESARRALIFHKAMSALEADSLIFSERNTKVVDFKRVVIDLGSPAAKR